MNENITYQQLHKADLLKYCHRILEANNTIIGTVDFNIINILRSDARFKEGVFYGYHRDVGKDLIDFRSHRNCFGKGSLQIVIDYQTGNMYADIDKWSPYEDVVSFFGHTWEVIKGGLGEHNEYQKSSRYY